MTAIWAHRGASAVERENSLAAFAAAVRMGADGIELDVRRTADGAPAVHHDALLPDGRPIAEILAADLPAHVPVLDAALDACGELLVNIEIKEPPELAELVVAVVRDRGMADRVLVSCFDLGTIDRVRARDDGIPTAYLVVSAPDGDQAGQLIDICRRGGHAALHPLHVAVDAHLVELAHEAGVAINTWTVDEPARVLELAAMGVDAVITNAPDVALRTLNR
jgi:glycerophosphoryl diester phosphodiesterase